MKEEEKKELYTKIDSIFKQMNECLSLLEKKEKQLYQEFLTAIDKEKMEKIKNRINNLNDL